MLAGWKTYLAIIGAVAYCAYGIWSGNMTLDAAAQIVFPMLGIGGVRAKLGRDAAQ